MDEQAQIRMIRPSDVTVDSSINPRDGGTNPQHVAELREWLEANGDKDMVAVVVYSDGKTRLLSEGFHRHEAYTLAGREFIPCEVRTGDRRAAKLNAAASNKAHPLKRTNGDKQLAVRFTLEEEPTWTDRQVAEHVGVAHPMVSDVRASMAASEVEESSTSGQDEERSEVEESSTSDRGKGRRGGSAKKAKKEQHAEAAARVLLRDHTRDDADVAAEVGCNAKVVTLARKALEKNGRIPKVVKPKAEPPKPEPPKSEPAPEAPRPAKVVPPPTLDGWGIPVQPHAVEAFATVPEFNRLVGLLKQVQQSLTELAESPGGHHLLRQCQFEKSNNKHGGRWVMAHLDNAVATLQNAAPKHTDCPYAHNPHQPHAEKCPLCLGKLYTGTLKNHQIPPDLVAATKAHYGVADKEAS